MNVEDRLRSVFTDTRRDAPAWPDPVGRITAGVVRRRRRRLIASAALAVSVVALASAGVLQTLAVGPGPAPRPGVSDVVPWQEQPVSPPAITRRATRPDSRPCEPSDLGRRAWTEGTQPGTVTLLLANSSDTRCTLRGTAALAGLEQFTGKRRLLQVEPLDVEREPLGQRPATIDPGEPARIDLEVLDRCPDASTPEIRYGDVEVVTLGHSVPVTQLDLPGECPVRVGQWYVLPPPLYTPFVSASIEAPKAVQRGADFTYVVTLRNESGQALSLSPCPTFTQQIGGQNSAHRLNCTVGSLGGHRSRQFEMRMRVPADTQLGQSRLGWMVVMGDGRVTIADLATGGVPLVVEE